MSTNEKEKCQILIDILTKIYENRLLIQKKLRKKKYSKKSLTIFRKYLNTKEYMYLKYFYFKFVKHDKINHNSTKNFVKTFLKTTCNNIFFREYYVGCKHTNNYEKISNKSFFDYDKRVVLDKVVINIIQKGFEYE